MFVCLFVCLYLSVCLSVYLSVRSFVRVVVCLITCVFLCLCVCVCLYLCWLKAEREEEREREGMCLFSVFGVVCCVLLYNPCACTLFVFGSGWSTVARLKLEGIDGKAPSGAEPAACERVGGGEEGERVSASIASPCVRSKRPRVYRHQAHQAHIFHTCGLGAGTHADVSNVHTEAF